MFVAIHYPNDILLLCPRLLHIVTHPPPPPPPPPPPLPLSSHPPPHTHTHTLSVHHIPLVPHICVNESVQHWFRATSHYLNQCWTVVNCTLRNKLQHISNRNTNLFIHENISENIVCEMTSILSRERWVDDSCLIKLVLRSCCEMQW